LSNINLAQLYFADKLYVILQTPTEEMIADYEMPLPPKEPYNYSAIEANRFGAYNLSSC